MIWTILELGAAGLLSLAFVFVAAFMADERDFRAVTGSRGRYFRLIPYDL